MNVHTPGRRRTSVLVRLVAVITLALAATAGAAAAQKAPGTAKKSTWKPEYDASLRTTFDQNPFRLTAGQRNRVGGDAAQYEDVNSPHDFVHSLRLRGAARGRGLAGRKLRVGGRIDVEAATLNRRRSDVTVGAFATQDLSKRDALDLSLSFTPAEFRRNYLVGDADSGDPEYAAGVARRLKGEVEYERRVLRGKRGAPRLDVELAVGGERRTYADLPWRNRSEMHARVAPEVRLFRRLDAGLEIEYARARHDGGAEPVQGPDGVELQRLNRDYGQLEIGGELELKVAKRRHVALSYERRVRSYAASLQDDPVYGGRRDGRHTVGAELKLGLARTSMTLGGSLQAQTTQRPGRGDTGDEADYRRFTSFVRFTVPR